MPTQETINNQILQHTTRRHFFSQCRVGLGSLALAQMMNAESQGAPTPLAVRNSHFPAKAKNVIYMFMAGGPSQLDLFDEKP